MHNYSRYRLQAIQPGKPDDDPIKKPGLGDKKIQKNNPNRLCTSCCCSHHSLWIRIPKAPELAQSNHYNAHAHTHTWHKVKTWGKTHSYILWTHECRGRHLQPPSRGREGKESLLRKHKNRWYNIKDTFFTGPTGTLDWFSYMLYWRIWDGLNLIFLTTQKSTHKMG